MKVRELIAELQKLDPELDVCIDDHDYDFVAACTVKQNVTASHDHSGLPPGTPVAVIW